MNNNNSAAVLPWCEKCPDKLCANCLYLAIKGYNEKSEQLLTSLEIVIDAVKNDNKTIREFLKEAGEIDAEFPRSTISSSLNGASS